MLILLSIYFKELSLGKIWFFINGNSLVGFQSIINNFSNLSPLGNYFEIIIITILNLNIFLLLGAISILFSYLIFHYYF